MCNQIYPHYLHDALPIFTDRARAVDHLALQVALVHNVEVYDADTTHARCCQIQGKGRTQPARADEQYAAALQLLLDRKSTRLNSSHRCISYAVFCLKKIN